MTNWILKLTLSFLFAALVAAGIDRITYQANPYLMLPLTLGLWLAMYVALTMFERLEVQR